jgi:nucleotide-binding universal stress UspA family protein
MKITWAIDVFGAPGKASRSTAKFLRMFAKKASDVSVAYVATRNEPNLYTAFDVPESERFSKYPLALLRAFTRDCKLPIPLDQHVVASSQTFSLTAAADELCKKVKPMRPDLIAVQTYQKGGIQRALLGSFAETLVHRSPRSLLAFNPGYPLPSRIKTIFFADDLAASSAGARKLVASLAVHFSAKVRIVHVDFLYHIGIGAPGKSSAITEHRRRVDRALARSLKLMTKKGIDCKTYVDKGSADVATAILKAAEHEAADLIVVAAKTGPLGAALLGSTTRKVIRSSSIPVVIAK